MRSPELVNQLNTIHVGAFHEGTAMRIICYKSPAPQWRLFGYRGIAHALRVVKRPVGFCWGCEDCQGLQVESD